MTRGRESCFTRVLPFVCVGLAVALTTAGIGLVAKQAADEGLQLAVQDIEADCDDQLTLLLHVDAGELAKLFTATNGVSRDEILRTVGYYCVDEYTLVGADGRIIDTSAPGARAGDPFFTDETIQGRYRDLLDGTRLTVRQRFRPSTTHAGRLMKYFALALPHGRFLQIGFLWESFERAFQQYFLPVFEDRVVSEMGFCIVLDDRDTVCVNVAGHPGATGKTAAEIGLTPEDLGVPLGTVFRATVFGTRCRCMAYPETIANRRILAVIPVSEGRGLVVALMLGVALVLIAIFFGFRLILGKFRQQQAKIDALRAKEEARRAEDMALARAVQHAELRTDGTHGDGYRLRALMDAAREVGGDFYDYYELPDGRLVLTIADVSGKGIPAALFMMKSRTTIKACVFEKPSLAEAVAAANALLAQKNPAELFVTAWVGVWDRRSGRLDYVSAGHNSPIVKRADGAVEWLQSPRCAALGVFEKAKYRGAETRLAPRDGLFLYTDGVTEAMNRAGELFGDARLEDAIRASDYPLVPSVVEAVGGFTSGAEQSDDITMLELEVSDS